MPVVASQCPSPSASPQILETCTTSKGLLPTNPLGLGAFLRDLGAFPQLSMLPPLWGACSHAPGSIPNPDAQDLPHHLPHPAPAPGVFPAPGFHAGSITAPPALIRPGLTPLDSAASALHSRPEPPGTRSRCRCSALGAPFPMPVLPLEPIGGFPTSPAPFPQLRWHPTGTRGGLRLQRRSLLGMGTGSSAPRGNWGWEQGSRGAAQPG